MQGDEKICDERHALINNSIPPRYFHSRWKSSVALAGFLAVVVLVSFSKTLIRSSFVSLESFSIETNGFLEDSEIVAKYHESDGLAFAARAQKALKALIDHPLQKIRHDMDTSQDPCNNFYKYACGGWLKRHQLPPDRSHYFRSFSGTDDIITGTVRLLLEEDKHSKAGQFYQSCVEKRGVNTVGSDLKLLDKYTQVFEILDAEGADALPVMKAVGILHASGLTPWFFPDVDADPENPTVYTLYIGEGGLGLPDKSYYSGTSKSDKKLLQEYEDYLEYLLTLGRFHSQLNPKADTRELAKAIISLETSLSMLHPSHADMRQPELFSQRVKASDFDSENHAFLSDYLRAVGVYEQCNGTVIIQFTPFFEQLGYLIDTTPRSVVKAYIVSWAMKFFAGKGALGSGPLQRDYEFYLRTLHGQKAPQPNWYACFKETDTYFPDALAKLFIKKYFGGDSKVAAEHLIEDIEHEFGSMLRENKWIDEETRQNSLKKLQYLANQIGYPDRLDTYDDVVTTEKTYGQIVLEMLGRGQSRDLANLGKPLDHNYWYMSTITVNAYYVAMRNSMTFPGGILQPPFYHISYPAALKYGGIGAVMGHELTHAFDNHGSRYNGTGFLHKIWSSASSEEFSVRSKCLTDLYSTYQPKGLHEHLNGKLTLSENIADLGGVRTGFRAMKKRLESHPSERIGTVEGMNDEHYFFVQFAQSYCYREALPDLRVEVETDPHSPGDFRVKGVLSQYDEFSRVFKCPVGSPYNPPKKCDVW
mmetsp:Transcript_8407/g.15210  ORF Transcript_8407/g.15210 Transcript_8407/m.15210 type:complete len:759 (-) Transcript_8407:505-2781(-)|eukprot:CAMPEP_0182443484 /NCGR_PEP_ID=MMETSP1172-20130603/2206_1 /TAXON_ID=708627 /ORGANISM="Timspurckia oligopyrenoides, Strain CCMP3278" /LENGTH=758 /DNA_ID=CAMNT_0024638781 /DNA_START=42 /DNA_END=2315 /DNA_ORIENTATION=+